MDQRACRNSIRAKKHSPKEKSPLVLLPSDPLVLCDEWWSNLWTGVTRRLSMYEPNVYKRLMLALQNAGLAGPGRQPYLVSHGGKPTAESFQAMAQFAGEARWPSIRGHAQKGQLSPIEILVTYYLDCRRGSEARPVRKLRGESPRALRVLAERLGCSEESARRALTRARKELMPRT
jgi:hypothetical protein